MSTTTAFIAELIRAANEIGSVSPFERRRLLERSVATILDMREAAGIPSSGDRHDMLTDLTELASEADTHSDAIVAAGLLEAADMIRNLRVVLDSGTVVSIH